MKAFVTFPISACLYFSPCFFRQTLLTEKYDLNDHNFYTSHSYTFTYHDLQHVNARKRPLVPFHRFCGFSGTKMQVELIRDNCNARVFRLWSS
jgi:hypothetical protein